MNLLIDTHVLIWWLANDPKLNKSARQAIEDADQVWVSSISAWEIESKRSRGMLDAPDDLQAVVALSGFRELALTLAHAIAAAKLPLHHRDPFDRMLVAQASAELLTLVTHDRILAKYQVAVLTI